ncbi:MAG: isocitrate/isopropylmalate family dehydrogenase, partial [Firmicutes bacterium]|nr:isocitrate/isopropylmalate family dehydrogenase [Bacillota bacterium]
EITPIEFLQPLKKLSPLKNTLTKDTTLFVIKESLGSTLKTEQGFRQTKQGEQAYTTEGITIADIERIAKSAYEFASFKNLPIVSIDMADKTENGKLWRRIVSKIANAYPAIKTTHMLIEDCLFALSQRPKDFGILLTSNMIGQILTAQLASLTGVPESIASANIGLDNDLYYAYHTHPDDKEPNPIGCILSTALLLSQSCKLISEAKSVERALKTVLATHLPKAIGGTLSASKFTETVTLEILNAK